MLQLSDTWSSRSIKIYRKKKRAKFMLVFITEQTEFHIKYFISFQYIIQSLPKPYYYFLCIFMHCKKLKKKPTWKNLQYWAKSPLKCLLLFFIPWNYSRPQWLKLLSSVKHFKSLDSEAHWSNLIFSELFYQTLPSSYDVNCHSGETDFISPPEEGGMTSEADKTATKEQRLSCSRITLHKTCTHRV